MTYHHGNRIQWRYVTPDNLYVAILDTQIKGSHWAFVARSAFDQDLNSEPVNPLQDRLATMCYISGLGTPDAPDDHRHREEEHWPKVCKE